MLYSFKDAVETTECVEWTNGAVLGASAKLMKAAVSFVMSARPFVCMHGATRLLLHVKFCIGFYYNLSRTIQVWLKLDKNNRQYT